MAKFPGGKTIWRGAEVITLANKSSDELLDAIAFEVMQKAKPAAPVDTGFLRDAIYIVTPKRSTWTSAPASGLYQSTRTGKLVKRSSVHAEANPGTGKAAVVSSAKYSIYIEKRTHFLNSAWMSVLGSISTVRFQQV